MKNSRLSVLTRGLLIENPVFVLVLGTCPTLATTKTVIGALSMGLAAAVVLVCSNVVISLLRKVIPDKVRIPCFIVIIAGFVTVVAMLMHAYFPDLYDLLGVFLSLITVNCIILGRAEMFASKNGVLDSFLDGLGMGLGFTAALIAMSTIREVLGSGSWAGIPLGGLSKYSIPMLAMSPGGFLVFGILIAAVNAIVRKKGGKPRKLGCAGCPSAAFCHAADGAVSSDAKGGAENA